MRVFIGSVRFPTKQGWKMYDVFVEQSVVVDAVRLSLLAGDDGPVNIAGVTLQVEPKKVVAGPTLVVDGEEHGDVS